MTQAIAIATPDYVALAADRRLTDIASGAVHEEDSCKIVAIESWGAIAYTGYASLEGRSTHEWLALQLAEAKPQGFQRTLGVIADRANRAFRSLAPFRQTFLLTGWSPMPDAKQPLPVLGIVSNAYGPGMNPLPTPSRYFECFHRCLTAADKGLIGRVVGTSLQSRRSERLVNGLRSAVKRGASPRPALELLAREIQHTATAAGGSTVGMKVLAVSIPKLAVTGRAAGTLLADLGNREVASFAYFDPQRNAMFQYGPTAVCGGSVITDVETSDDLELGTQSSSIRILRFEPTVPAVLRPAPVPVTRSRAFLDATLAPLAGLLSRPK